MNETAKQNYISTEKFAKRFGVKPDTVRRNLCTKGSFMGLKPIKMPNHRLLWPDVGPESFLQLNGDTA